jgi:hypothetical protein
MMEKNKDNLLQELQEKGYVCIQIPTSLFSVFNDGVYASINKLFGTKLNDLEGLTNFVMGLGDEEFVTVFDKANRFFDIKTSQEINNYVKGMSSFFDADMAGINFISPDEVKKNPNLSNKTLDIFFRCIRPGKPDVGQPHSDYQFWEMAKGTSAEPGLPFAYDERWKIWIPLMGCNAENSLKVLPGSHNLNIPFTYVSTRSGLKPAIDLDWLESHEAEFITPDFSAKNSCILFNDKLIHFGPENCANKLRISSELTVLLKY